MAKVVRMLIYEGDDRDIAQQLDRSMKPGQITRGMGSVSITCVDMTDAVTDLQARLLDRVTAARAADRLQGGVRSEKGQWLTDEYVADLQRNKEKASLQQLYNAVWASQLDPPKK